MEPMLGRGRAIPPSGVQRTDMTSAARLGLPTGLGAHQVRPQPLEARVVGTPGFGQKAVQLGKVGNETSQGSQPKASPTLGDRMSDSVGSGSLRAAGPRPASSSMGVVQQLHAEGLMRATRSDSLSNSRQSANLGGDSLANSRHNPRAQSPVVKGVCAKGHPLQECTPGKDTQFPSHSCDLCKRSNISTVIYRCKQCDYDLCHQCVVSQATPKAATPTNSLGASTLTSSPHAQNTSGPALADGLQRNPSGDRVPFARGPGSAASSRSGVEPRRIEQSSATRPPSAGPASGRPAQIQGTAVAGRMPTLQVSGSVRVPPATNGPNGASASEHSAAPVPGTAPASTAVYESRLANMEGAVKSFDQMLRDSAPPVDANLLEVMHQCEALACELDEQRKTRQVLEERAKHLDKLLRHERGEREAWLVAFLTSLHTTLQELTVCIDRSIADSNTLMKSSMDGTDEVMHDLIDRVDQLLIQKESELEPLMEQDGELFEA